MLPSESRTSDLNHLPKVKVFGGQAALCAEAVFSSQGIPTINIEVAPKQQNTVDWHRKVVIQLSDTELPLVCAVLLGYLNHIHLKRPGKGIEIERQANKLFIRASQGADNIFMLPASIGDTFKLSAMMLARLKQQSGMTEETLLLAALRGAASLFS